MSVTSMRSPMRTISLRTIAAHKLRLVLTILSVVLGTAFIAGSSMFTSSLSQSFTSMISSAYDDVDLVVQPTDQSIGGLPLPLIEQLRADPDVRGVSVANYQSSVAITGSDGKALQTGGLDSSAFAVDPPQQAMSFLPLKDGAYPQQPDEIAVNTTAAEKGNIKVGDTITVVTPQDRSPAKVTGIFEFGADAGGTIGVLYSEPTYLQKFTDGQHVSQASISLNDGASADSVRERLSTQHPTVKFETGQALVEQTTKQIKTALSFVNYFLWAFAGISLLVGTFIISNTFSMIVAQRNREFALLRSIGTKQSQITRAVIFEAIIVGIIGSLLGIAAGVGIVRLIYAIMEARGFGFPSTGLGLTAQSIAIPLIVGIIVTVLSAWAPARRAGAVRPVQAMRSGDQSSSDSLLVRTIFGGVVLALGVALVVIPAVISAGGIGLKASIIGAGAFFLVIGLWLAGPMLSIPLVGGLGRIVGAPFGVVGKLAATNSRRNPRRTATTSFALTLGLMMVSSIGMLGATMRDSTSDMLDSSITADFVLTGPQNSSLSIPKDAPERINRVEGVDSTATVSTAPILVNNQALDGNLNGATSPVVMGDISRVYDMKVTDGTIDTNSQNGIVLSQRTAQQLNVGVGDQVTLSKFSVEAVVASGNTFGVAGDPNSERQATVQAITEDNSSEMRFFIPMPTAEQVVKQPDIKTTKIFVKTDPGASQTTVRENLEKAVADDIVISVLSKTEYKGQSAQGISQMLNILYGLLALAVVIAVLGIINTLALSVIERRREIGMLRAVGTQRGQIRRMIYIESAVIALFGALIGAAIGLGVGWAFVSILSGDGLDKVVIPWMQVLIMLVGSGFVGVLAAVWPGHKAAKTKPLEAISE